MKHLRIILALIFLLFAAAPTSATYLTSSGLLSEGGFYISSAAASGAITATAYIIHGGTTTALGLKDFTHATPGRLTYIGSMTKKFNIICSVDFTSSQSNQIARFRVAKGGTPDAASEIGRKLGTGTDLGALAIVHEIELATNEYVEIHLTLDVSSSDTITVNNMVCVAEE